MPYSNDNVLLYERVINLIQSLSIIRLTDWLECDLINHTDLLHVEDESKEYYYIIKKFNHAIGYVHIEEASVFDYYDNTCNVVLNDSMYLAYIQLYEHGLLKDVINVLKAYFNVHYLCAESSEDLIPLWEHVGARYFTSITASNTLVYHNYPHRDAMFPFII